MRDAAVSAHIAPRSPSATAPIGLIAFKVARLEDVDPCDARKKASVPPTVRSPIAPGMAKNTTRIPAPLFPVLSAFNRFVAELVKRVHG
jgi:hypothetical protein